MRIIYTELSRAKLTSIYRAVTKIMDEPEGSTRKARHQYIKVSLEKIFPNHIIYVSKNISYFMQSKSGTPLLIVGKNQMKALIYAPRPYALPRLHNFQNFSTSDSEQFGKNGEKAQFVHDIEVEKNTMVVSDKDDDQELGEVFSQKKIDKINDFLTIFLNKYHHEKVV